MPDRALAEKVVGLLNELFNADPAAARALLACRVPCNQAIADHPAIVVAQDESGAGFTLGLVGLLNGLLPPRNPGDPAVAASYDEATDELIGFRVIDVQPPPAPE